MQCNVGCWYRISIKTKWKGKIIFNVKIILNAEANKRCKAFLYFIRFLYDQTFYGFKINFIST